MAVIKEHISGTVELYDHIAKAWATLCTMSDSNVISASSQRQCCASGSFGIGGVFSATLSLTCRLPGVRLFDVRSARIRLYSQYEGEAEPYCIGTFWVTDASRTGDIFSINAQDAVGWTDTSSYNDTGKDLAGGLSQYPDMVSYGRNLLGWAGTVTGLTNGFIQAQTGVANMLTWENYDKSQNNGEDYGNAMIYVIDDDGIHLTAYETMFYLYTESGLADSDCPRDYFRWIAELAGGFIYAKPENGALTLGQFGQPEFGTAEIGMEDIQYDSCNIADYTLQPSASAVRSDLAGDLYSEMVIGLTGHDYANTSYFRYLVEANPFLDGFTAYFVFGHQTVPSLWTIAYNIWCTLGKYGGMTVRPFQCTVHKAQRYHLGQKIKITYQDFHEHTPQTYNSIITVISWTFRGGHTLACGGGDTRVMADCLRASKGDKAIKEARNRAMALRNEVK